MPVQDRNQPRHERSLSGGPSPGVHLYTAPAPLDHRVFPQSLNSCSCDEAVGEGSLQSAPAMANAKLSPWLLLVFFAAAAHALSSPVVTELGLSDSDSEKQCVYTVYVRTGSIWKGGTDSRIGATLVGSDGTGIRIEDLELWGGLMGADHDYFERGNLDIFSGRGPCMHRPPCRMNLTSDGSGAHHGWYCNYLEVTATGPHMGCSQTLFTVEQWLATDASPYRLYALVDNCRDSRRDDAGVTAT